MGETDRGRRSGTRVVRRRRDDRQTGRTRRRLLHNRRGNGARPTTSSRRRIDDRSRQTRAVRLFRYVSLAVILFAGSDHERLRCIVRRFETMINVFRTSTGYLFCVRAKTTHNVTFVVSSYGEKVQCFFFFYSLRH